MILNQTSYPPTTRGTVIVWGLMGSLPVGGMIWQVLHNVVPLRRLGFDVWYIEDSDRPMYDLVRFEPTKHAPLENIERVGEYLSAVGLGDRWAMRVPGTQTVIGATDWDGLQRLYAKAVAALNLCGAQDLDDRHMAIPKRIYLQTDPVGTQIKVAEGDANSIDQLNRHNAYFTYGLRIGTKDCTIPYRYPWKPTVPPVCLDFWGYANGPAPGGKLSTVLNWRHNDRNATWNGKTLYWSKDREFRRFFDIPSRSPLPLELCLGGANDTDKAEIASHGWGIKSSTDYLDPFAYRDFIVGSLGEFSAAKEMVVVTRSGWVSDRTVCYLAAGRPAIVQDTGIGTYLPLGTGLFTFNSNDEALAAIEAVAADYERHSRAAKAIAREYFDGERVLGKVMAEANVG